MSRSIISDRANELLVKYGLNNPPLDPVVLAHRMNIKVMPANFKKDWISGGIHKVGEDVTIYVKATDSSTRQRFTIAHEIGHYILHMGQIGDKGILESIDMFRSSDNSNKEIEANEFAASLLMPEKTVRNCWGTFGSTEILADLFCVSLSAMSYRLYKLGLKSEW